MLLATVLVLPLAGALACLLVRGPKSVEAAQLAALSATLVGAFVLAARVVTEGPLHALGTLLYADALSALVILLGAFVAALTGLYTIGHFRLEIARGRITERQARAYHALTLLFVAGMLLAPLAHSLGLMWAAIEATTIVSTILIALENRATSLEAAWKYIIIGSFGVALALLGTILTYYSAVDALGPDRAHGLDWTVLSGIAERLDPRAMRLAFVLALIGYGTKAGLVPMHTWKPDAYSEAPVPTATLLAAGLLNCALYGLLRFHSLAAVAVGAPFVSRLLLVFGLASMALAALFVVGQRNLRRLLAYSSIDHAGIIVAAVGIGGPLASVGAMLHMTFHAVTKPVLFFAVGAIQQRFGTASLGGIRGGLLRTMPFTSLFLLGAALAVTASPPFAIFQSEYTILSGAVTTGQLGVAALFLACTFTVFAGFLQKLTHLVLTPADEPGERQETDGFGLGAMAVAGALAVLLGFWLPWPVRELVHQSAAIVGGPR